MARLVRRSRTLALAVGASLLLGACGVGGAVSDARQSCGYVKKALAIEARSTQPGLSASRVTSLQSAAMSELLKATPAAARATSSDGSWNALMTTINEVERVPFANLVPALTRLCRVADSSSPYL